MKHLILFSLMVVLFGTLCFAQVTMPKDSSDARKDSIAAAKQAKKLADSLRFAKLFSIMQYPSIKGGKWSGVIPVENPTEVPDPNHDYKLLFDLVEANPDSLAKDINSGLDEVARVLNLHVASGISPKRIFAIVMIHGKGIEAVFTNEAYRKKHAIDNPNLKIVKDLENTGAKIIACGQAMAFFDFHNEDLLPTIKITLTAQTVYSNYQSQGYIRYVVRNDE